MDSPARVEPVRAVGAKVLTLAQWVGQVSLLLSAAISWAVRSAVKPGAKFDWRALTDQLVRVGTRATGIVILVQMFIGVILALQMTPPLRPFGQENMVANIIGVAGFRMLAPILTAVVLAGFAGASIAAELGSMVVAEEIEALEAMALNPIRFLVVPRVMATLIAMLLLTVIADWMIAAGGWLTSRLVLGPECYVGYWSRMADQLVARDVVTGMIQAGVFGLLIAGIACREGLAVTGGAAGVGKATTQTVVYSIVAIISAACVCTIIFYAFGL